MKLSFALAGAAFLAGSAALAQSPPALPIGTVVTTRGGDVACDTPEHGMDFIARRAKAKTMVPAEIPQGCVIPRPNVPGRVVDRVGGFYQVDLGDAGKLWVYGEPPRPKE